MWSYCLRSFPWVLLFVCTPCLTNAQPDPQPEEVVIFFPPQNREMFVCIRFNSNFFPSLAVLPDASAIQPTTVPEGLTKYLEQRAVAAIDAIDQEYDLTAEQKHKFLLAAELEQRLVLRQLNRLLDEINGMPFDEFRRDREYFRQIDVLRRAIAVGPARPGTLLSKLLEYQLTSEQRAKTVQYHLQWFLDATTRSAVLNDEQRQALLEVLSTKAIFVSPTMDRKLFLRTMLRRIRPEDLAELNEPRAILAVMRFVEHCRTQP